jgi:putative aldouronate transport system substrate-binding protein
MFLSIASGVWAAGRNQASSGDRVPIKPSGTFPIADQTVTISVLINDNSHVSDFVNNTFTQSVEQKLGIKLDIIMNTEGKRDLLLNTGDYPEVFLNAAGGVNGISRYGMTEHIFIPVEPYLEQYGKNILIMFDQYPGYREGMTAPDGHIYAFGPPLTANGDLPGQTGYKLHINTEWLNKLRLKIPTTTDELLTVFRAFKTRDLNGNGRADEIPLSGAINTWLTDPYIFLINSFTYWDRNLPLKLKNGAITGTVNTDGFREGIRFARRLFDEGLYDPAAFTQTEAQLNQLGSSNPVIMGAFTAGHMAMGINVQSPVYRAYDVVPPLRGSNGYRGSPISYPIYPGNAGIAITDKAKNPEAAVRLIDYFFDLEVMLNGRWGPKGYAWDLPDPGATDALGGPAVWKALPGMDESGTIATRSDFWHNSVSYPFAKELERERIQFSGDILDPVNYSSRLVQMSIPYREAAADVEPSQTLWADPEIITELNNMVTPIQAYVMSAITEFVTGTRNIETDWNAYLTELERLGYSAYIKKYSDTYFASIRR